MLFSDEFTEFRRDAVDGVTPSSYTFSGENVAMVLAPIVALGAALRLSRWPPSGGGGFDAASVVALAILAAAVLATYLSVRFAGQGPTPGIEAEVPTRPEHREHANVP